MPLWDFLVCFFHHPIERDSRDGARGVGHGSERVHDVSEGGHLDQQDAHHFAVANISAGF
jgi:hypothetical protein